MPYPCSGFCADIRFDNRFGIKLGDSFHVNHTINFVTKYMIYGIVCLHSLNMYYVSFKRTRNDKRYAMNTYEFFKREKREEALSM